VVTLAHAGRVLVFAFAAGSSGVPASWAAREDKPGVDALPDLSEATAAGICERVRRVKSRGDLVVASIHWGSNWDYDVPVDHVRFAHWLVDGGVDLVHGHSSHHPRPMEVYRKRLILYGCGDFINDYEGIEGYEEYRGDLVLMYFASLSTATGELTVVRMTPMQTRNLSLRRTSTADLLWLRETLGRINAPYGTTIESSDQTLTLRWGSSSDAH
jgi:poly-gamma-glutamate synthesis protein (capsule biosynthesis protein)